MNNSKWIEDIKLNLTNHNEYDILNNFEKFISDHGSKVKFEPNSIIIEKCIEDVWHNYLYMSWINQNKNQILIAAIYNNKPYYWTYETYSKWLNPQPGDYTPLLNLKDSDFPDPEVKIINA